MIIIHYIFLQGKQIGEWFGPNTIAQVIQKLVLFDDTDIVVHVAMDNTVVIEDIKKLCKAPAHKWGCYQSNYKHAASPSIQSSPISNLNPIHHSKAVHTCGHVCTETTTCGHVRTETPKKRKSVQSGRSRGMQQNHKSPSSVKKYSTWRPLVLFIPLRLGLTDINSSYYPSLKVMFTLRQSLGVIGGKPNHAHYFVGFNGDMLIYLDPHTTQQSVEPETYCIPHAADTKVDDIVESENYYNIPDESFHCAYPSFMNFSELDPSVALGFYCHTEADFDDLCLAIKEMVMDGEKRPMFELCQERPCYWPPFELPKRPNHDLESPRSDFTLLTFDYGEEDMTYDSSGEYEIL